MNYKVTRPHSYGMAQRSWLSVVLFVLCTFSTLLANNMMPTPEITGSTVVCPGTTINYSTPATAGSTYQWTLSGGGILTNSTAATATVEWTAAAGSGPFTLTVTEMDQMQMTGSDALDISIQNTTLSCDDLVQISLDQGGLGVLTPAMFLVGNNINNDNYTVNVSNTAGVSFGDVVNCSHIGQNLTAKVTSLCNGNSCWSEIIVEDKLAPIFACPPVPTEIPCDTNIDNFPPPLAIDNCGLANVFLVDEVTDNNDICGDGVLVVRSWVAQDIHGNQSGICQQELLLVSPDVVDFPSDITWNCDEYNSFPNITNPTALTGNLPTTGSGFPAGIGGIYCPFNYTYSDDTLAACSGLKIIRSWTVLNWCSGEIITTADNEGEDNEQIIKVIDVTPPVISATPQTLNAETPGSHLNSCTSTDFVNPPTVTDNCSGFEIRIFTPIGELDYANGIDGAEGGNVPSPGLPLGVHIFTIEAIDDCGNVSELNIPYVVEDLMVPTPVCDEITDANVTNNGVVEVFAETFDDGSHDNCGICDFEVKRMNQSDAAFAPSVTFTCFDDVEMVVLRVYDCSGNHNECMVEVHVNDKLNPTCLAPPTAQIDCQAIPTDDELADNNFMNNLFGEPSYDDNCDAFINYFPVIKQVNNCGEGAIIRSFQAIDFDGNTSGLCQQVISIMPVHNWEIAFPADFDGTCGEDFEAQDLEINNSGCDLLASSYTDQLFAISDDGACYKIVRTYEIINWCTADDDVNPIVLGNNPNGLVIDHTDFNNYGHYTYQQIIKITDDVAPTIEVEDFYEFCSIDEDCLSGIAEIPYIIDDACTEDLEATYEVDYDQDGSIDLTGTGAFEKNLPMGCHNVTFIVEDGCGNIAIKTIEVCIVDCKSPTAYCEDGLIIEMNPNGMVDIWASDFDAGSFDNCEGDLTFSFSADTTFQGQVFECYQVPMFEEIVINIFVTDAAGNVGICETFVIIQDNQWTCDDDPLIAGSIGTPEGAMLENAMVELNGAMNNDYMTDTEGNFKFMGVEANGDYTVTPSKNDDPLNGVTTFDLVKISQHILNISSLDSPYKMIAADINNSGSITTLDLVQLRRMVLLINDEFINNSSWRFIDAAYDFPDPSNPWAEDFPEVIGYNNVLEDVIDANFIAVKIGDINSNASTNGLLGADDRNFNGTLKLKTADLQLKAGQTYSIPVQTLDNQSLLGFQFSLNFDKTAIQINQIAEDELVTSEFFGFAKLAEGVLTNSWNVSEALHFEANEDLFAIEITALKDGRLSDVLSIGSDYTLAEAYQANGEEAIELLDLQLVFHEAIETGFTLYQNTPNPFHHQTTIGFEIPEASMTTLTIYDITGKVVKVIARDLQAGYHEVRLQKSELPETSILFYQLEAGSWNATRKMLMK